MIKNSLQELKGGEIKLKGYDEFITDFVIKNQLLDKSSWKLFTYQYKNHTDNDNRWRGEYWGKMMRGASLCYKCIKNEKLYVVLKDSVLDMISCQEKDGRISSYPRELEFDGWDMWSRKYILLGFLYFYDICKSQSLKNKIINTCKRHLDYIVSHVGNGKNQKPIQKTSQNYGALNSSSILEPVVKLYNVTGKKDYLDFAKYIVEGGFCADGDMIKLALEDKKAPFEYPQTKAYEMMSCFQGLLEYYKATGEGKYFTAVVKFFDKVAKTDLTIAGSSGCDGEFFDNSSLRQTEYVDHIVQETCVTVTWMNLCYSLLLFTGDSKYAEYLENSSLNAMYGSVNTLNQTMKRAVLYDTKGDRYYEKIESFVFDSYSPLVNHRRCQGVGGFNPLQNGRSYGCCACIGSAGVAISELYKVLTDGNNVYVNGYSSFVFATTLNGEKVLLKSKANLYKSGKISLTVSGGNFKLYLRKPKWSKEFAVLIDGEEVAFFEEKGYAVLCRNWDNTKLEIKLKERLEKVILNDKVAIKKGPIVLARDDRFGEDIAVPVSLTKSVNGKAIAFRKFFCNTCYKIKTKNGDISMCDYSSAGKNFDDDKCNITVWMQQK